MYTGFTHLHSSLRYILVALMLISIVLVFKAFRKKEGLPTGQFKLVKLTFILTHVQLLIGLVLYGISPRIHTVMEDFSLISANKELSFFGVQHPVQMLIAIAIFTIGYIKAKKLSGLAQSKTLLTYWFIAFGLIFISIPWPFLKEFGTWY